MARGCYLSLIVIGICVGYSLAVNKSYYMDQVCEQSLHLKDHDGGIHLHLTESDVYGSDLNCSLRLIAKTHHRIEVRFISLNISSFVECPEDYLAIVECPTDEHCEGVCCHLSSLYCCHQHNRRFTRYCGVSDSKPSYTSVSNVIGLNFISDANYFGKGFHLHATSFHEGPCTDDEVKCRNGRCVEPSYQCQRADNCDGSFGCMDMFTPAVIAGLVIGGVIIIFTSCIALVILWYHRKHRIETRRSAHRRERYVRRHSTPAVDSDNSYSSSQIPVPFPISNFPPGVWP